MKGKRITLFVTIALILAAIIGVAIIKDSTTKTTTEAHLQALNVQNWDNNSHNITVIIERNETIVYWKSLYLKGTFKNESDVSTFHQLTIPKEKLGGKIENYVLLVRVNETGKRVQYNFMDKNINEISESCDQGEHLAVSITVRKTGSIRRSVVCEKK